MSKRTPMPSRNEAEPNAFERYFRAIGQHKTRNQARRPWLLAVLALACATLVIVGSFGPWESLERVSRSAPEYTVEHGTRSDGAFTILFAIVAIVALLISLFWRNDDAIAWLAFGALALCAMTGLLNWLVFAPPETSLAPGATGTIIRVEWGLKLVGLAGGAGALITWLVARRLYRD